MVQPNLPISWPYPTVAFGSSIRTTPELPRRNTAIEVARGEFLYFMDGDDWCEPDMLARMHAVAHENELDLLVTGFFIDTYYSAREVLP